MKFKIAILLAIAFWSQSSICQNNKTVNSKPQYVWMDEIGVGRNNYVYFRNVFELKEIPSKAYICLYANSNYNLLVNGQFLNYGPIRSYAIHPYFDSIDISSYLKKGKNVVAVKVLNYGMNTFQVPFATAGFIAWGNFSTSNESISLQTPGSWICRKAQGYNPASPRFSFAQGSIECFDARLEPDNWSSENIIVKNWKSPKLLKNQQYFGTLQARPIPLLTNFEIQPKFSVNELNLSSKEQFYNWNAQFEKIGKEPNKSVLLYSYFYSPEEKDVPMGFSWGKFWINGKLLQTIDQPSKAFRSNATVHFVKGWNTFFAVQEIIWDNLDGMIAFPADANIQLSTNKKLNDTQRIAITDPCSKEEVNKLLTIENCKEKPELLKLKWKILSRLDDLLNPAKELAWLDVEKVKVNSTVKENISFSAGKNQALVFDFGGIQLGRIFADIIAPVGTKVDFTWSEDLKDSFITLYKRMEVNAVARFITIAGKQHLETFRPFGLRYLQVTIRNNPEPVTLLKVGVNRQIYPYTKKGSFTCSDRLLNDIWEMGWRTVQVCSEDSYTDTPFRERGHYAGDFVPEFATTLATSGDPRLAKQTIKLFNDVYNQKYTGTDEVSNSEFPLYVINVASWYIRQFNDINFAEDVYKLYANFLKNCHKNRGVDGFYREGKLFIDWTQIDKKADLTIYQTIMYSSFVEISSIATLLGKKEDAQLFTSYANELKQFIQTSCWDANAGNFIDGMKNGKVLESRFPSSSIYPSVWKITNSEQEKSIQNWFSESLINIGAPVNRRQLTTPYGGFYALASLYQSENAGLAEQYIRKHWGKMVIEANDLTWEDFNRDAQSTMSHAWSSSPTYYMSTQILGVELGFPGNLSSDTIYIRPQSENLSWAKGTVPHPKGLVTVDWKIVGTNLYLNYSAPKGVPVVVKPRGRLAGYHFIISETK